MTVADDLATIKEDSALLADWAEEPTAISNVDADNCRARIVAAVEGVEAEIARLHNVVADYEWGLPPELYKERDAAYQRAKAAEAEVARFRAMEPFAKLYADSQAEVARLRDGLRLVLRGIPDPMHPSIRPEWVDKIVAAQIVALDLLGENDGEDVEKARALLAEDGADR